MDIVQKEYENDKNLKKENVKLLQEWCDTQPHLPKMTEHEAIWFLKSCYYSNENAKTSIDSYFTIRTLSPELFKKRDNNSETFNANFKVACFTKLPKKTHEGHTVFFFKFLDPSPEHFSLNDFIKMFDMIIMQDLYLNGTHEGLRCCVDVNNISIGLVAKLNLISMKKFLSYLQEGMPIRLKGLHYINANAVLDKALNLVKPLIKKEVMEMLTVHQSTKKIDKHIPLECLPDEYGGKGGSVLSLFEQTRKTLFENDEFFEHQDEQMVDESKRPGKPKNVSDIFGVDGTFKKLDIF